MSRDWASRHPSVRVAAVMAVIAALFGLACCGGTTGSTQPTASTSAQTGATASPGGSTSFGTTVTVTSPANYRYSLSASRLHRVTTVTLGGQVETAAPGKTFIDVDVLVKNPLSDRSEPLEPLAAPGSPNTAFSLGFPSGSLAAYGITTTPTSTSASAECKADGAPPQYCLLIGGTAALTGSSGGPVAVGPNGTGPVIVHVVSNFALPESAPLENVGVFVQFLFETAVQVPLAG